MNHTYNERNLPATTHVQETTAAYSNWKLTKSQYAVFYWLIAHSCWSNGERHYYIYDKEWKQTQIAADCQISTKTVSTALKVLMEKGLIVRDLTRAAYQIYWPQDNYAAIDKNLIISFIGLSMTVDVPLFIKLYTLLVYGYEHNVRFFTINALREALGISKTPANHMMIMSMVALWEHWHLLELVHHSCVNTMGTRYIKYEIKTIRKSADELNEYMSANIEDLVKDWKAISLACNTIDVPLIE